MGFGSSSCVSIVVKLLMAITATKKLPITVNFFLFIFISTLSQLYKKNTKCHNNVMYGGRQFITVVNKLKILVFLIMDMNDMNEEYFKGRGAQVNPNNKFLERSYVQEYIEGLDEPFLISETTKVIATYPKSILSKVDSPDLGFYQSLNPYQGCEHGCIYCYARNSHEYWGYSAGLDFERKILVKYNAVELLEKAFENKSYKPETVLLSGNTDCYQPIEKKLQITRKLLLTFLDYRHPVSIISKNVLMLRDLDILASLAELGLVRVS